jgi:uncharacterized protein (TIGR02246 family)
MQLGVGAVLGVLLLTATAATAADPTPEEKALQKRAEDFVAAFNKGDAKAVAGFWTPEGDFIDQEGHQFKGRKAIEKLYTDLFGAEKGAKLALHPASMRVVKPDLAIEDGVTEVTAGDGSPPSVSRYTVVHVKQDGQWYLESVRESAGLPPAHSEHLEELAWLVGDWEDEAQKGAALKATFSWDDGENFLVGSLVTAMKDIPVSGSTQWVGWDAAAKRIRSWNFVSSGGFSEGTWTKDGNKWTIDISATLPDGKKMTATNVITKVDKDHLTWQSSKRMVDGKPQPDIEPVKIKRAEIK